MDKLLRIKTVADRLCITPRAIYHLIANGKLPVVRVTEHSVRVREKDLEAYLTRLAQRQKELWGYSLDELRQAKGLSG